MLEVVHHTETRPLIPGAAGIPPDHRMLRHRRRRRRYGRRAQRRADPSPDHPSVRAGAASTRHRGQTGVQGPRLLSRRHARPRPHARLAENMGRPAVPVQVQPASAIHRAHVHVRRSERDLARHQPAQARRHHRVRRILRAARHRAGAVGLDFRTPVHGDAHARAAPSRRVSRGRRPSVRFRGAAASPHAQHHRTGVPRVLVQADRCLHAAVPHTQVQHLRR